MITKKDPAIIQGYMEDSSNLKGGRADKVFLPQNIAEISSILKEANRKLMPVTISGAGTGQSGGRIPFGGWILSMEKMNVIRQITKGERGGFALVESGVLIKDLKEICAKKGLFYTYDPTEQTAFIGGTIATNASGARSFRYGSTRRYVESLRIALADGSVFDVKRGAIKAKNRILNFEVQDKPYCIELPTYEIPHTKKSSAGYYTANDMDLVDLFIGQEGTLCVIVEARLKLIDKPQDIFSCFTFFKDSHKIHNFIEDGRRANPLSIEYFDKNCLTLLREKCPNVPEPHVEAVFFEDEIQDSCEDKCLKKWETILTKNGISLDNTWVAMNEKTRQEFLEHRHFIPERMNELVKRRGFQKVSTDLAVPAQHFSEMLNFYKNQLQKNGIKHFIFGHAGDAHLHVNILPSTEEEYKMAKKLQLEFVKKSISFGGTISAEHGVGKTKREFLKLLYGEKGISEMRGVKETLDPNFILGRGNVFEI